MTKKNYLETLRSVLGRSISHYYRRNHPVVFKQKTKRTGFTILRVFNFYQNCKNLDILYLKTFNIIN